MPRSSHLSRLMYGSINSLALPCHGCAASWAVSVCHAGMSLSDIQPAILTFQPLRRSVGLTIHNPQ